MVAGYSFFISPYLILIERRLLDGNLWMFTVVSSTFATFKNTFLKLLQTRTVQEVRGKYIKFHYLFKQKKKGEYYKVEM